MKNALVYKYNIFYQDLIKRLYTYWRMCMTKKLLEIAADIVQVQASSGQMSAEQVEMALIKTFTTLQRMQKAEEEGTALESVKMADESVEQEQTAEKIHPKESIQDDRVICLECGATMKQLTAKHLGSHDLTIREYKQKWGFPLKQSLSAKSLSKARSKAAKKRGLPENLVKYREERKMKKLTSTFSDIPAVPGIMEEKTIQKSEKSNSE